MLEENFAMEEENLQYIRNELQFMYKDFKNRNVWIPAQYRRSRKKIKYAQNKMSYLKL